MSTRSVVAVPNGDLWEGRYCHHDGYPEGVGRALLELVQREGVETVIRVLTQDHFGWSSIDPTQQDTPGHLGQGRDVVVPGWGTAYSHSEQPDEWISCTGDSWSTEYAYVLMPSDLVIYHRTAQRRDGWTYVDRISYAKVDA